MKESTQKEYVDYLTILDATEIWTHFERDEGCVDLRWKDTDTTIVSWDTPEEIENEIEVYGNLSRDPKKWHDDAVKYAIERGLVSVDDIPEELRIEEAKEKEPCLKDYPKLVKENKMDDFQIKEIVEAEVDEIKEVLGVEEQEEIDDVWDFETDDEEFASEDLNGIIDAAMEGDSGAINYLVKMIWKGDSWETIKERVETEGSTWYVWYMDGVREHYQNIVSEYDQYGVSPVESVKEAQRDVGKKSAKDIYRKPKRDIQKKRSGRPTKEVQPQLEKLKALYLLQAEINDAMKEMKNNLETVTSEMKLVKDAVGPEIALHQDNMVVWQKAVFKFIEASEYLSQTVAYKSKAEKLEKALIALGKEGKKEVDRINEYMNKMRKTKRTPADIEISMKEAKFLSEGGYESFLRLWNKFTDWVKSFSGRVKKIHDEIFEWAHEVEVV